LKTNKRLHLNFSYGWVITVFLILLSWSIFILCGGQNPLKAFSYMVSGVFGSSDGFFSMLNKLFIFILAALAYCIPAWTGMWNIGGDGQLMLGGFISALIPLYFHTEFPFVNIMVTLLFAALLGGLWALWPALLRVHFGVDEVVTTLMSNYIVDYFTDYMINIPYRVKGSSFPRMEYVPKNFQIPNIIYSKLSLTFIIALIFIVAAEIFRKYFISGYDYRITGSNQFFARQGGIDVNAVRVKSMFIGGMLAGLAGGLLVLSVNYTFMFNFSNGYGFTGLLIALISGNMPLLVFGISMIFVSLQVGAINMHLFTTIPAEITGVLQSIMVFFIAARKSLDFRIRTGGKKDA